MTRYYDLKEENSEDITGVRYVQSYTQILYRHGRTTLIHGLPACPECGHTLDRKWSEDTWCCAGCGTMWNTVDLVQAIETESASVTVSIRSLK